MAGFFGLFDQSKPGPGVSKDEPQKKAFFKFFELYGRKFWKLAVANLLYVLVSLPVVTQGLAQAGLTYITRNFVREKHAFVKSDFFDTIKKNWKQALVVGILELVVGAIMAFALYFYWMSAMTATDFSFWSIVPVALSLFMVMMFVFTRYYLYLQMITFRMSLRQLIRNSVLFAMAGVKQNLLITFVLLAVYAVLALLLLNFFWIGFPILIAVLVFFLPAFRSFLIQFTIFPLVKRSIIDPYYKEHPEEDVDKRHDLNLEVEAGSDTKQSEAVFTDVPRAQEREESVVPRQYSEAELKRGRRLRRSQDEADEDGTI